MWFFGWLTFFVWPFCPCASPLLNLDDTSAPITSSEPVPLLHPVVPVGDCFPGFFIATLTLKLVKRHGKVPLHPPNGYEHLPFAFVRRRQSDNFDFLFGL